MKKILVIDKTAEEINILYKDTKKYFGHGLQNILLIGEKLTKKKSELKHGKWIPWIENNLIFGREQAHKYMKIFEHKKIIESNVNGQHLAINQLIYEIRKVEQVENQSITKPTQNNGKGCTTKDLYKLIKLGMKFGTIYADPPWNYENQATRSSTNKHYQTSAIDEIISLPINQLTEDKAHLHFNLFRKD